MRLTHRLARHQDLDALRTLMDIAISELQKIAEAIPGCGPDRFQLGHHGVSRLKVRAWPEVDTCPRFSLVGATAVNQTTILEVL